MSVHRYPAGAQRADLIRGGGGLLLTAVPLAALTMHWAVVTIFAAAALLFAAFTWRIVQRSLTHYECGEQGVVARGPLGGAVDWNQLSGLKLHFFSTRRDRGNGWMLLTLKGGGRTLKLESTLTGFDEIIDLAAETAIARGLTLTESTTGNLLAMGAPVADPQAAGRAPGAPEAAQDGPPSGEGRRA